MVYNGVLGAHRTAQETVGEIDAVSEDMLIGQIKQLELFHWFVRAHLETVGGDLTTGSADSEFDAAQAASEGAAVHA